MSSGEKERHLEFLKRHFAVPPAVAQFFTQDQMKLLEAYGHWFKALEDGTVQASTPAQRHFVAALKGLVSPETEYESLWLTYQEKWAKRLMETTEGDRYSAEHGNYGGGVHRVDS